MTKQQLTVEGIQVAVIDRDGEDYIPLTDMVRANPTSNSLEFDGIKSEAGLNRFAISIKQWIAKTNAKASTPRPTDTAAPLHSCGHSSGVRRSKSSKK
jgi:hypothetical protein